MSNNLTLPDIKKMPWHGYFYDIHAPLIYGIIHNLTADAALSESIFIAAFEELLQKKDFLDTTPDIKPYLLKFTIRFTVNWLNISERIPESHPFFQKPGVISLLLTQCNSVAEVATLLAISENKARQTLRLECLKLRQPVH